MPKPSDILQERYRLIQPLGQNAGRQTWLAEDLLEQAETSVIVKLLTFPDQVNWNLLKLFEREANILRQLNHPRIPKYRDFFSIEDRALWFGLVQEYITGVSLKTVLERGERFTIAKIYQIANELLDILTYLHDLKPPVLHRDIKPSNLIWGQDQHVYLVDFGAVQEQPTLPGQSFTVVGSYGYTPIEQFGGQAVRASDLYALGATLIHLLTGACPADIPQKNLKIQWHDRVTCSPAFVLWLDRLLEPDVQQRFQTTQEAQTALAAIVETSLTKKCYDLSRTKQNIDPYLSTTLIEKLLYPPRVERLLDAQNLLRELDRGEVQLQAKSESAWRPADSEKTVEAVQHKKLPPLEPVDSRSHPSPFASSYEIKSLPGTKIQVERSRYALTIYNIPDSMAGRGCLVVSLNSAGLFAIFVGIAAFIPVSGHMALFFLFASMTGLWWLNRLITRSQVQIMRFEGKEFTVRYLNQPNRPMQSVNIAQVDLILSQIANPEGSDWYRLSIQTPTDLFHILMGTNSQQAQWLENEIRNWLKRAKEG
jgi:serine/threonine protein kinase